MIKKAIGLPKGSGEPNRDKVGKITRAQLAEIAETKMEDLNANDIDAAMRDDRRHGALHGRRRSKDRSPGAMLPRPTYHRLRAASGGRVNEPVRR